MALPLTPPLSPPGRGSRAAQLLMLGPGSPSTPLRFVARVREKGNRCCAQAFRLSITRDGGEHGLERSRARSSWARQRARFRADPAGCGARAVPDLLAGRVTARERRAAVASQWAECTGSRNGVSGSLT